MKYLRFTLILSVISVMLTPLMAHEQSLGALDAKILFGLNSNVVEESFEDNAKTIALLDSLLLSGDQYTKIEYIEVVSSSSIDGSCELNKSLSRKRIDAVRTFLVNRYPAVPQSIFRYVALGENWDDLRASVVADANVPYRSSVLAVIDNSSTYDSKEVEFKNIHEGIAWDYMKEHIFPQQRYGAGLIFELKEEYRNEKVEPEPEPELEPELVISEESVVETISENSDGEILLALKTNLLADLLSALNIELEVPIGNRYSVSAELTFPWWRGVNSDFTMQFLSGHFEGKYWFGDRSRDNRLLGLSAGIYRIWNL